MGRNDPPHRQPAKSRRTASVSPSGPLGRLRRTRALAAALTHPSVAGPHTATLRHLRQRLELLGDAVWNLAVIVHLLRDPGAARADVARRKAHLAGGPFMAEVARRGGLGRALRTGHGPEASALKERTTVLAGTLEAVLGAWYLQEGMAPILRFASRALRTSASQAPAGGWLDPKSELQQVLTRRFHSLPTYRILERSGSAHAPEFLVEVALGQTALGSGRGASRRVAEHAAARAALKRLAAGEAPAPS